MANLTSEVNTGNIDTVESTSPEPSPPARFTPGEFLDLILPNLSLEEAEKVRSIYEESAGSGIANERESNTSLTEAQILETLRMVGDALGLAPLTQESLEKIDTLDDTTDSIASYTSDRTFLISESVDNRDQPTSHNDAVRESALDQADGQLTSLDIGHIYVTNSLPLSNYVSALNENEKEKQGAIVNLSRGLNARSYPLAEIAEMFGLDSSSTEREISEYAAQLTELPSTIPGEVAKKVEQLTALLEQNKDNHFYVAHTNDVNDIDLTYLLMARHPQFTVVGGLNENGDALRFNRNQDGTREATPEVWFNGTVLYINDTDDYDTLNEQYRSAIMEESEEAGILTGQKVSDTPYATPEEIKSYIAFSEDLGTYDLTDLIIQNNAKGASVLHAVVEDKIPQLRAAGLIGPNETLESLSNGNTDQLDEARRERLLIETQELRSSITEKYRAQSPTINWIEFFADKIVGVEDAINLSLA